MSAACTNKNLFLRAYTEPTSIECRTLGNIRCIRAYSEIFGASEPGFFQLFDKGSLAIDNVPIMLEMSGHMPVSMDLPLKQGEHPTAKYHPHAKRYFWNANNRHTWRTTISRYGPDRHQFASAEEAQAAAKADINAMRNAMDIWQQYIEMKLFSTDAEIKKVGCLPCCSTDGSHCGMWEEILAMYEPTDGGSKGNPMYENKLSVEQIAWTYKADGTRCCCCPTTGSTCACNGDDCCFYKVKTNPFKTSLEAIRDCVAKNKRTAVKNEFHLIGKDGAGCEEAQKLLGLINDTRKYTMRACMPNAVAYNIGLDCTADESACCTKDCATKCTAALKACGLNIGTCLKCEEACGCCCCAIPRNGKKENLIAYCSPELECSLMEMGPIANGASISLTPENLGVGKVVFRSWLKADQIIIIDKNTLGLYTHEAAGGTADYPEQELSNTWAKRTINLVVFPGTCFTVKKPT